MYRFGVAIAVVVALAVGLPAGAAPVDPREVEARADFAAAHYQEAVAKFARLYADTADPVYLRNIGRCYQKMRRAREAIDSFQEYLHKAKRLSPEERQEIEGYIRELQALDAAGAIVGSGVQPVPTPDPSAGPVHPVTPVLEPPVAPLALTTSAGTTTVSPSGTLIATSTPASAAGRGWRAAGIVTAAAGICFVAAGVAFGAAAESAADSVSKQYAELTESAGKRDAALQWVGYGVGAAAIAAGAIMYWHGRQFGAPADAAGPLHGRPMLDPHGGGFVLEAVFP